MRPPRREERRTDGKKDYVTWSLRVGNHVQNSKYVLREMIKAPKWFAGGVKGAGLESPEGKALNKCKTLQELCHIYGVDAAMKRKLEPLTVAKRKAVFPALTGECPAKARKEEPPLEAGAFEFL